MTDIAIAAESRIDKQIVRLRYESTEMGVYEVTTYCDVHLAVDPDTHKIIISPRTAADLPPVVTEIGPSRTISTGEINATLTCMAHNQEGTMIRYQFSLNSSISIPGLMRFIPLDPIQKIVQNLVTSRLEEQVDRFIKNATRTYLVNSEEQNQ